MKHFFFCFNCGVNDRFLNNFGNRLTATVLEPVSITDGENCDHRNRQEYAASVLLTSSKNSSPRQRSRPRGNIAKAERRKLSASFKRKKLKIGIRISHGR